MATVQHYRKKTQKLLIECERCIEERTKYGRGLTAKRRKQVYYAIGNQVNGRNLCLKCSMLEKAELTKIIIKREGRKEGYYYD